MPRTERERGLKWIGLKPLVLDDLPLISTFDFQPFLSVSMDPASDILPSSQTTAQRRGNKNPLSKMEKATRSAMPVLCTDCAKSSSSVLPSGAKFICSECWAKRVAAGHAATVPPRGYACCPLLSQEIAGEKTPLRCVCGKWWHTKCLAITNAELEAAVQRADTWTCPECDSSKVVGGRKRQR